MEFLGYCPYEKPKTWGEKLEINRTYRGLSCGELADRFGMTSKAIKLWERDKVLPNGKVRKGVEGFMGE